MRSGGPAALSVDIDANLALYEAALAEADALLARAGGKMSGRAREIDRALEQVGRNFGSGFDQQIAEMDRGLSQVQARINGMFASSGGSARESGAFLREALDAGDAVRALEAQLDPAVAALHRYEAAQEQVARAVEMGAIEQTQATRVLELSRQRYMAAMGSLDQATLTGSRSFNRLGGTLQQAGYQVGDFAVQVASGQSAIVALTQQGAQLAGAFGPWGAAIGAAGAILGAFATTMFNVGEEAESLEDKLDTLNGAIGDLREAANLNADGVKALIENYGKLDGTLIKLIQRQTEFNLLAAKTSFSDTVAAVEGPARQLADDLNLTGGANDVQKANRRERFGLSEAEAAAIAKASEALKSATDVGAQIDAINRLGDALEKVAPDSRLGAAAERVQQLRVQVNGVALEGQRLERAMEAAAEATKLLSEGPEAVTRIATEDDDRKAGRKRADAAAKVQERVDKLREMIGALEDERAAIGLTDDALARHEATVEANAAKQEIFNLAQKEGVAISEATRAKIDELAQNYVDLAVAVDAQQRAADEAKESNKELYNAFAGSIRQADSLADALRRVGVALVELAARGAILGEGPFKGLFDSVGAPLGTALGSLFAPNLAADPTPGVTGRASGGPARAGVPYYVNEHLHGGRRTEIFVPSMSGGVLNVPQAQAALAGSAGGGDRTARVALEVSVRDDGMIGVIARQAGAEAALPVAVKVTRQAMRPSSLGRAATAAQARGY